MDSTNKTAVSEDEKIPDQMRYLVLNDLVVFPNIVMPIFLIEEDHQMVARAAYESNDLLFIAMQKENQEHHVAGSVVSIIRLIQLPDGRLKILVQGVAKAVVSSFDSDSKNVNLRALNDLEVTLENPTLMRETREHLEVLLSLGRFISPDMMMIIEDISDPGRMADVVASNLGFNTHDVQSILCCEDPVKRLQFVDRLLVNEIEILRVQVRIQSKAKEEMNASQQDYFLREQMRIIREELGDAESREEESDDLKKRISETKFPGHVEEVVNKQFSKLSRMHQDAAEATIVRNYLDWLLDIPWGKQSDDTLDLEAVQEILDDDHFGLKRIKDRILEYLAVKKLTNDLNGPVLCLVGPPGVGKTSLGRSVARSMNREFARISLGGVHDEAEIRGHRRTYIGAMPGRIVQALKKAKTMNPVIMLDEVDKLASDYRGDPSAALLEVLDPEQNHGFFDHYLDVEIDLSKVLFLANANSIESIPSPLLDRMEVLELSGYADFEKVQISERFLIPRSIKNCGLKDMDIKLPRTALLELIHNYTRETGLRSLEKQIHAVMRKTARDVASGKEIQKVISVDRIVQMLGPRQYEMDLSEITEARVATVTGLAWTRVGGDIMHIECSMMPGKGSFMQTGQLGDVMKESIQTATSYVRSKAEFFSIDERLFQSQDFHFHVPAGAVPKDGPSAGIAMCVSLISVLTGMPIHQNIAMTGEFTLHGRILPIGGLKEKLLAAMRGDLQKVLVPERNRSNILELEKEITEGIEIVFVADMEDVLRHALEGYQHDDGFKFEATRFNVRRRNHKQVG